MKRKSNTPPWLVQQPSAGQPSRPVIGVAWYRAEQWPRLRAVVADSAALHDTYAEWEQDATEKLRQLRAQGIDARPVFVDPDEFVQWCNTQGLAPDGKARSGFVAEKLERGT